MDNESSTSTPKANREGRPLRKRGVSFNVLPLRQESAPAPSSSTPILVDYASIRQRKQLNLSDFLQSDNPITFVLFTFWHGLCLFGQLLIMPFVLVRHLYLLMLQVYGVRHPTASTTTSDLFSISSTPLSTSQQRPIVWILSLIDYIVIQLTRLPDTIKHTVNSTRKHVDGTVSKSFNLIDTCTSNQITKTYSIFKRIFFERTSEVKSKTKR